MKSGGRCWRVRRTSVNRWQSRRPGSSFMLPLAGVSRRSFFSYHFNRIRFFQNTSIKIQHVSSILSLPDSCRKGGGTVKRRRKGERRVHVPFAEQSSRN